MKLKAVRSFTWFCVVCTALALSTAQETAAQNKLFVGWATTSITPDLPVMQGGRHHTRIARRVHDPITATAVAIEKREGGRVVDQLLMVSCDLTTISGAVQRSVRERLAEALPDFDSRKFFMNATHTHNAPPVRLGRWGVPEEDEVMIPSEYVEFLVKRVTDVAIEAWEERAPGAVSWALGHAVVGYNRRAVYADGHAQMYGDTHVPDFSHIEGAADPAVDLLYFWNQDRKLTGVVINVACPSQALEGNKFISAGFWHVVRERLHAKYGQDIFVYPMVSAAGDLSPHLMFREEAEQRLLKRKGVTLTEELGGRIVEAVVEAYSRAEEYIHSDVVFMHKVEVWELSVRQVTKEEVARARERLAKAKSKKNPSAVTLDITRTVIDRYEHQEPDTRYPVEVHAIRIGDVAIATNQVELFLSHGIRIESRSEAEQTFVVQLASPTALSPTGDYPTLRSLRYLPTQRAVLGGGYSAEITSSIIGPEGGRELVNKTVSLINSMWK